MSKTASPSLKTNQLRVDELKQDILRVAMRHFAKKGFAKTNMDEIAAELGIHKPSIYYHIGKKEDLFDRVVISSLDNHLHNLAVKLENTATPEEKLNAYIVTFADTFSGENRYLANLMLSHAATQDGYFPQAALEKMMQVQKMLRQILAQGVEQHVFKAVNPFMIHMLITGFFTSYAASDHVKERIAKATNDNAMLEQSVGLHEAADILFGMLLESLKPGKD